MQNIETQIRNHVINSIDVRLKKKKTNSLHAMLVDLVSVRNCERIAILIHTIIRVK